VTGGVGFRIETVWAFLADHGDGDEGVVSAQVGSVHLPLIAADPERLKLLRPVAEKIARQSGVPITLCRFTTRTDMERIEPEP
jgi:hypothetical protein